MGKSLYEKGTCLSVGACGRHVNREDFFEETGSAATLQKTDRRSGLAKA